MKGRSKAKYNFEQSTESADLPATWARVPLGYFCDLQVGIAFKTRDFKSSGIRLLRGANIAPGTIHWTETKFLSPEDAKQYRSLELRPGDIVIGMDRPIISSGLKVARVNERDIPAVLVQRVGRFIPLIVQSEYLHLLLLQDSFVEHLLSLQTGTDIPHVSATDILSFVVPLAPMEEQKRIIAKIEQLLSYADDAEDNTEITQRLTHSLDQAILSKAFRGELVSQDPNDEPAAILLKRINNANVKSRGLGRRKRIAIPGPNLNTRIPKALSTDYQSISTIVDKMGGEAEVRRVFEVTGLGIDDFWNSLSAEIKKGHVQRVQRGQSVFLRVNK